MLTHSGAYVAGANANEQRADDTKTLRAFLHMNAPPGWRSSSTLRSVSPASAPRSAMWRDTPGKNL